MSRHDREPVGVTIAKVIGAVALLLVALAFGAGGACGAWVAVAGLWDSVRNRGTSSLNGFWIIGAVCAVVGLAVAGLLVWGIVLIFRKKPEE
jgi:hypothetical protein